VTVAFFLALVISMRNVGLYHRFRADVSTWMFLAVVQGGVGYVQYFNDIPAVLVAGHVALATALWVSTVHLALAVLAPTPTPVVTGSDVHATETRLASTFSSRAAPTA
jgi:cytochrome c oxidase assembly protein subunit 15